MWVCRYDKLIMYEYARRVCWTPIYSLYQLDREQETRYRNRRCLAWRRERVPIHSSRLAFRRKLDAFRTIVSWEPELWWDWELRGDVRFSDGVCIWAFYIPSAPSSRRSRSCTIRFRRSGMPGTENALCALCFPAAINRLTCTPLTHAALPLIVRRATDAFLWSTRATNTTTNGLGPWYPYSKNTVRVEYYSNLYWRCHCADARNMATGAGTRAAERELLETRHSFERSFVEQHLLFRMHNAYLILMALDDAVCNCWGSR